MDQHNHIARLMTCGGDARITIDPASGANRYMSTPYPRRLIAYASSTANDISADAFAHVTRRAQVMAPDGEWTPALYGEALDGLRARLRTAYALPGDVGIAFAPSGTDLEYIALAANTGAGGVHNLLLGADEVGSGCIHSANGAYFAKETALDAATVPGAPVAGLGPVTLAQIPVRDDLGRAQDSCAIAMGIRRQAEDALAKGMTPLIHIVHGSKTGLVLPELQEVDALIDQYGDTIRFVVDACQARITTKAINAYLERGIIVFLTGSKFMGGPPFSGMALIPPAAMDRAAPLAQGLAQIFRRAELPAAWPGREILPDSANAGLLLRLEASIFELERFQALPIPRVMRVIDAFQQAVGKLTTRLLARQVDTRFTGIHAWQRIMPLEMQTLVTLDIGNCLGRPDFDAATGIHKALAAQGIRLGQPVRSVRTGFGAGAGGWAGTLRIGLSMPQIVGLDQLGDDCLGDDALAAHFAQDMTAIGDALTIALLERTRQSLPA